LGSIDGEAVYASFNLPSGVAADGAGNLYVADQLNFTMRRVSVGARRTVHTLAGAPGRSGATDGVGGPARFVLPWAVALDARGNRYVADSHTIRKVDAVTQEVRTVVGDDQLPERVRPGPLPAALAGPGGLAVLSDGGLALTDSIDHVVLVV